MKLKVNLKDPAHVRAAAAFFNSLAGVAPAVEADLERADYPTIQEIEDAPKPKRKSRAKAKSEPAKSEPAKAEPAKAEPDKSEPDKSEPAEGEEVDPAIQAALVELRTELAKKDRSLRPKIKDKLTSLGAASISLLKPEDYSEMLKFLKSI